MTRTVWVIKNCILKWKYLIGGTIDFYRDTIWMTSNFLLATIKNWTDSVQFSIWLNQSNLVQNWIKIWESV